MLVADLPFNVISLTSPYLVMWDTVQTKSSDRIYRGSSVYVQKKCSLMRFVCARRQRVCACAHAHTKLGVTMDSKGAFEVF